MVSVTNSFKTKAKDFIEKNEQIISQTKKLGKSKWLKHLYNCLSDIGSTTTGIIVANTK